MRANPLSLLRKPKQQTKICRACDGTGLVEVPGRPAAANGAEWFAAIRAGTPDYEPCGHCAEGAEMQRIFNLERRY